jgi:hypothetical protein
MRIARGSSLLAFGLSSMVVITACGVAPIDHDQVIILGPNEGIAAVVTYVYQPVTQLAIEPEQSSGKALVIPNVQAYSQIYLIPAPAGRYCFGSFRVGKMAFFAKNGHGGGCFEVRAGYVSFSNPFAPSMLDSAQGVAVMEGDTSPEAMLRERYPLVAKRYPLYRNTD